MSFYSRRITKLLQAVPGEKTLGVYRFLPLFFLLGAALEFSMINWTVGETNFYRTFKRRQAKDIVEHNLYQTITTDSAKMPAGVSWSQYLKFTTAAFLSMTAGSQTVHLYYKPLRDLNVYVERELESQSSKDKK